MNTIFVRRSAMQLAISFAAVSLAACGGGGSSSSNSNSPAASQAAPGNQEQAGNSGTEQGSAPQTSLASTLFVGILDGGAIAAIDGALKEGTQLPEDRLFQAYPETDTRSLMDVAFDSAHDRIYAIDSKRVIYAFNNARATQGSAQPSQTVTLTDTTFQPTKMAIDNIRGQLYISGVHTQAGTASAERIAVFGKDASGALVSTPVREFTDGRVYDDSRPPAGTNTSPLQVRRYISGIELDQKRDIAYVLTSSLSAPTWAIHVFKNASTLSGKTYPDQIIDLQDATVTNKTNIKSVTNPHIDSNTDTLYFGFMPGTIGVITNASTRSGKILADKYISLPTTSWLTVEVDRANDRLYGSGTDGIYAVDKVSSANGNVPGVGMLLSQPLPANSRAHPIAVTQ